MLLDGNAVGTVFERSIARTLEACHAVPRCITQPMLNSWLRRGAAGEEPYATFRSRFFDAKDLGWDPRVAATLAQFGMPA